MKTRLQFPNGFLWGAACASYQVEGGIYNCDWALAAKQGKVPHCGQACDHYRLFESDFDIAQKLGHNCHRFSIEWARIEPEEGQFDMAAAEHYKKVIRALKTRGLEPFVTLWHFTLPIWFSKDGGFTNSKSVERFRRYAEFVTREILGEVKFTQTINEPMVWFGNGYFQGIWPPFKKTYFTNWRTHRNLARAHRQAYQAIKTIRPDISVGIAKDDMNFESRGFNPVNKIRVAFAKFMWNQRFLNKIKRELDFIGLNFYQTQIYGPQPVLPKTEMGWYIYPEGIFRVLKEINRYGLPIYITENGIADAHDAKRADFIRDYLAQVHRAIQAGVDVRGYFYWSLLDNYEWAFGFEKRFGLVEIDYTTQERKIRPSAFEYKKICESNSLEI